MPPTRTATSTSCCSDGGKCPRHLPCWLPECDVPVRLGAFQGHSGLRNADSSRAQAFRDKGQERVRVSDLYQTTGLDRGRISRGVTAKRAHHRVSRQNTLAKMPTFHECWNRTANPSPPTPGTPTMPRNASGTVMRTIYSPLACWTFFMPPKDRACSRVLTKSLEIQWSVGLSTRY